MCIFFFQAEDGIRDTSVTGVQTVCSSDLVPAELAAKYFEVGPSARNLATVGRVRPEHRKRFESAILGQDLVRVHAVAEARSEERRVGKEWRSGDWPKQRYRRREREHKIRA